MTTTISTSPATSTASPCGATRAVVRYAFAYVQGSIALCPACAKHYTDAALGPVIHGSHRGTCGVRR